MTMPRSVLLVGAAVVALVVATVAVVLLTNGRDSAQFAADTPEGALQRYLSAFDEGDLAAAYEYFSSDVTDEMSFEAYEATVRMYDPGTTDRTRRALFDGRLGDGDAVRLALTVEEIYGEGLSASSNQYHREVRMVRQSDGWRIDEPLVWLEPGPIEAAPPADEER